jgi:hypothetical protein
MARPHVQVPTENLLPALRAHMEAHLPAFKALPGVAGITLNGGMSRGYADHLSEVDLTVYLEPEAYRQWQAGGLAELPSGIATIDGQLYDLKVNDIVAEMAANWPPVALWDTSYAEILYDPEGKVAALFESKLTPPKPEHADMFSAWWYFELAAPIWIHRQDALQAHHMLNKAIEPLVGALFIANGEYVPHEKWLLHMSRSLAWQPERWAERLTAAMAIPEPTVAAAAARREVIAGLWAELDRHITGADRKVASSQRYHYDLLKWLSDRGEVSVAEWQQRASLRMLHSSPFHACVRLEGARIRLDRERLAAIAPETMYTWFYEIVATVRGR